ncbi:MAG: lipid-A-disaccharide synthase, partial [Marinilabiliales bacterium]
ASDNSLELVFNDTYNLLSSSCAALVTSGTATLETALFKVPQVVCYKSMGKLSYWIAKRLVKIKYISLVNLILDKPAVKELIQDDMNVQNVSNELGKILNDNQYRKSIQDNYNELEIALGGSGASATTASLMYKYLIDND